MLISRRELLKKVASLSILRRGFRPGRLSRGRRFDAVSRSLSAYPFHSGCQEGDRSLQCPRVGQHCLRSDVCGDGGARSQAGLGHDSSEQSLPVRAVSQHL